MFHCQNRNLIKLIVILVAFIVSFPIQQVNAIPSKCQLLPNGLSGEAMCQFIKTNCSGSDIQVGRLNYLHFTYCTCQNYEWLGILGMVVMLLLCFWLSGAVSSDFVLPNLATISSSLGISDALAGFTIIALGNSLPDVIGNILSLDSFESPGIALGNVFGGVLFMSMFALSILAIFLRDTKVNSGIYFSLGFLLVAIVSLMLNMIDYRFRWWDGVILIALYIIYVAMMVLFFSPDLNDPHQKKMVCKLDIIKPWESSCRFTYRTKSMQRARQIVDYALEVLIPTRIRFNFDCAVLTQRALLEIETPLDSSQIIVKSPKKKAGFLDILFHPFRYMCKTDDTIVIDNQDQLARIEFCPTCSKIDISTDENLRPLKMLKLHFMPLLSLWDILNTTGRIMGIINFIPNILFSLTTIVIGPPVVRFISPESKCLHWSHAWIVGFQAFVTPIFIASALHSIVSLICHHHLDVHYVHTYLLNFLDPSFNVASGFNSQVYIPLWALCLTIGAFLAILVFLVNMYNRNKSFVRLFSLIGLMSAFAWSYIISLETIGLLKSIGVILKLSDEILGFTLFVIGNNAAELATGWTTAKLGMPVMAIGSILGSALLHLLLNMAILITYLGILWDSVGGSPVQISYLLLAIAAATLLWVLILIVSVWFNKNHLNRWHGIFGVFSYVSIIASIFIAYYISPDTVIASFHA